MKIDYNDLIFKEKIKQAGSSHVYSGEYKGQEVAIKLFDIIHPHSSLHRLYGVFNICLIEYDNLLKVREKCPEMNYALQEPIGVTRNPQGIDILISKLVKDDNGSLSNELKDAKNMIDKNFISQLQNILYSLAEKKIYHMHLEDQRNILVHVNSGIHPVIIDFQSMNETYYPWLKITKHFGMDSARKRYFRRINRMLKSLEENLN